MKNIRKFNQIQGESKNVRSALKSQQMRRTSFLAELEFIYVYALRCSMVGFGMRGFSCGVGSIYFTLMLEYIDIFYDKADVAQDLRPYFKLLSAPEDTESIQ